MKKFKLLSLLLIISLFVCLFPVQALAVNTPEIVADSAVVMDISTGDIVFQKNSSRTAAPSTMTSIMTALVVGDAVSNHAISLDDTVTASDNFRYNLVEGVPALGIAPGEEISVKDLLYCAAMTSAMDVCNVLAEYAYGSVTAFVDAMNAKAQALGCTSTFFVNANGIEVAGQQTSARDLALMVQALASNTEACEPFGVFSYSIPATNVSDVRTIYSSNPLLNKDSEFYYEYAYGFQSAQTMNDGCCMVSAATYNEMDLAVVVLGCPDPNTCYSDTINLFGWVFNNFSYREILSGTESLETLPVEMGDPETVGVRGENQIRIILPNDQDLGQLSYDITYLHEQQGTTLEAPIEVAQHLGEVTVYMDGVERGSARLVAANSVDISRMEYLRSQLNTLLQTESVRQLITILLVVLGIYILLVAFYLIQRMLHLHSLRAARKDRAIAQAQQAIEWIDAPAGEAGAAPGGYFRQPAEPAYIPPQPAAYDDAAGPAAEPMPEEEEPLEPSDYTPQHAPAAPEEEYTEETGYAGDGEQYAEDGDYAEGEEQYAEDGDYAEGEEQYADDGDYAEGEEQYAEDEDYVEGEEQYAEDGDYAEGEEQYAEDGDYVEGEEQYAEDEDYVEDEEQYADDGDYVEGEEDYDGEDAGDGYDEPPEPPKRRRWRR